MIELLDLANTIADWRKDVQDVYVDGTALNAEDFKKVYVWGVGTTRIKEDENPDIITSKKVPDQYSVSVGYTGDNVYSKTESDSNWWPSHDASGLETALPWMYYEEKETGYEAWWWKETEQTTQSPTRGWEWAPLGYGG
ncbi:MAG: hypothetical protein WC974_03625 [Thermoplasmata archaeon]